MEWSDVGSRSGQPPELPADVQRELDNLSQILRELGKDYKIDIEDWRALSTFFDEFDIHYRADSTHMSGAELLRRWQIRADDPLLDYPNFPAFLFSHQTQQLVSINERLFPLNNRRCPFARDGNKTVLLAPNKLRNVWITIPHWWSVRRGDIEFLEKLKPDLNQKVQNITLNWLTPVELCQRWKRNLSELIDLVRLKNLPAYRLDLSAGVSLATLSFIEGSTWGKHPIHSCLFKKADVHEFETEHADDLLDLLDSEVTQLHIIDHVLELWREDPDLQSNKSQTAKRLSESNRYVLGVETIRRKYLKKDDPRLPFKTKTGAPKKHPSK